MSEQKKIYSWGEEVTITKLVKAAEEIDTANGTRWESAIVEVTDQNGVTAQVPVSDLRAEGGINTIEEAIANLRK